MSLDGTNNEAIPNFTRDVNLIDTFDDSTSSNHINQTQSDLFVCDWPTTSSTNQSVLHNGHVDQMDLFFDKFDSMKNNK